MRRELRASQGGATRAPGASNPNRRVAIVVQRCHESVVGGAESLAWQYAQLLKPDYDVDVLTSCAADADRWKNVFAPGDEERDGVRIRRFAARPARGERWHRLNEILAHHHRTNLFQRRLTEGLYPASERGASGEEAPEPGRQALLDSKSAIPWTPALQREWIRSQGPDCPELVQHIRNHRDDYRAWIFVTYLFAPTVSGMECVAPQRRILVPALHDEAPARLSIYRRLAHGAARIFWNTNAEAELGRRLWGPGLNGRVVSMGVAADAIGRAGAEDDPSSAGVSPGSADGGSVKKPRLLYILYCGRIDPGKGCDRLFRYYRLFQNQHPGPLKLFLTGSLQMKLPSPRPGIKHLGFVSESEKLRLMAAARAVIVPSPHESLSLITLEAMGLGTPVLAYGSNPVLREHVERSRGGLLFSNYESFRVGLGRVLGSPGLREKLGTGGRQYVRENFDPTVIRKRLLEEIAAIPAYQERSA